MDEDAFDPSAVVERLVLQVIGGWEQVRAQVNFNSFTDAGPDAEWAGARKLAKAMREMAIKARVRHPHDEWSTAVNEVNSVRRKFAHYFTSTKPRVSTPIAHCISRVWASRARRMADEVRRSA